MRGCTRGGRAQAWQYLGFGGSLEKCLGDHSDTLFSSSIHPFLTFRTPHILKSYPSFQTSLSIHLSLAHNPCLTLHFQKLSLSGLQFGLLLASSGLVRSGLPPDTKIRHSSLPPNFCLSWPFHLLLPSAHPNATHSSNLSTQETLCPSSH